MELVESVSRLSLAVGCGLNFMILYLAVQTYHHTLSNLVLCCRSIVFTGSSSPSRSSRRKPSCSHLFPPPQVLPKQLTPNPSTPPLKPLPSSAPSNQSCQGCLIYWLSPRPSTSSNGSCSVSTLHANHHHHYHRHDA